MTALERFYSRPMAEILADANLAQVHGELLTALEAGTVSAAARAGDGEWSAVAWVKTAILAGFKGSSLAEFDHAGMKAFDKALYPPRSFAMADGVRVVPGGNSARRGSRIEDGVVMMPPSFVNVGSRIGKGTMIDSHVLVGSCAWIGENVHLSAGVQVGGVLEPPQARPVVVEDGCFLGALSGVFEGVVLRERCVLAPGVILTASTAVHDLVQGREIRGEIPPGAVVVPGTRPASGKYAEERGISLYAPCVVKYRDGKTDAAVALEEALR